MFLRVNIDYNDTDQSNWSALASAAQAGDKKAYRTLLTALSHYIPNYLYSGLANPEWAQDITQDVLLSVHKALPTYAPNRPFKPWLRSIIHFRRIDFLRKHYAKNKNKHTDLEDFEFRKNHVTHPDFAGEYKDIETALGAIPAKQRHIFEMMKIKGYTAKEIADEMNMSESAVKVSAYRTANKLKDALQ